MKYFIFFILILLLAGCNLFQRQQLAEESVAVEEKQQQEEVFVPVQKELYVIDKEEREDYYLFGEKIKISAEGNEFSKYTTKIDKY